TLLFRLCFAALGAGNGALFQLVPLRWPTNTALDGSMIRQSGALRGQSMPKLVGPCGQLPRPLSRRLFGPPASPAVPPARPARR
ncbi:MFS transporter, partial [Methylobacterium radiotolerans]